MAGVGLQHPDGDPFANEKAPMSLLDRLEANAVSVADGLTIVLVLHHANCLS